MSSKNSKKGNTIGQLGTISFYASAEAVQTFNNMKEDSGVSYSEHKLHLQKPRTEMTGKSADTISFDITLSAFLGVKPKQTYKKLEDMMTQGRVVTLVLGTNIIGQQWVVTNLSRTFKHVFKDGSLVTADVSVTIKEYN